MSGVFRGKTFRATWKKRDWLMRLPAMPESALSSWVKWNCDSARKNCMDYRSCISFEGRRKDVKVFEQSVGGMVMTHRTQCVHVFFFAFG